MPIQPGLQNVKEIRKLNQIVKMWTASCAQPSPEIWIETFFPAFALALLSFLTPGKVEVIEMPLGRYHGLGGKVTRTLARKFLPTWVDVAGKVWKYTGLPVIERVLFWWMVVDLIIDTLYNWESLAMQIGGCKPGDKIGQGVAGGGSVYAHDVGWIPIDWTPTFDPDGLVDFTLLRRPAGMATTVAYGISAQPFMGHLGSYSTRLVDTATSKVLHESPVIPPHDDNLRGSGSFRLNDLNLALFDGAYQVQINVTGDFVDISGSTVTVGASDIKA